jgi:Domain of unknown function (DUF4471)
VIVELYYVVTDTYRFIVSGLYGDRYDNRKALSDWDYHNNIKAKASIIHIKQVRFCSLLILVQNVYC